jgi:hypothetical protein
MIIMDFVLSPCVGKFDMYVEDECAAYVRYCFADPMDAAIFRSRFEPKSGPFRLAGWASPRTASSTKRPTIPSSPIGAVTSRRPVGRAAAVAGNSLDKARAEFGVRFLIMDLIGRRMLQRPPVLLRFMVADKWAR